MAQNNFPAPFFQTNLLLTIEKTIVFQVLGVAPQVVYSGADVRNFFRPGNI